MTVAALESDMIIEQVVDDCTGHITGNRADDRVDTEPLHKNGQDKEVYPGGKGAND